MNLSPRESSRKRAIMDYLKEAHCGWFYKTKGGCGQEVGLPDIIGCAWGRFVAFEIKRPGESVDSKSKQAYILEQIAANNGVDAVVESVQDVKEVLMVIAATTPTIPKFVKPPQRCTTES